MNKLSRFIIYSFIIFGILFTSLGFLAEGMEETNTWNRYYEGISPIRSVVEVDDGGYVFTGEDGLFKVNSYGDLLWNTTELGIDSGSIVKTNDGDLIFSGLFQDQHYLFKADENGIIEWNKTYDFSVFPIHNILSGNIVLAGTDNRYPLLMVINTSGEEQWHEIYPVLKVDSVDSVIQTSDNGFIIGGTYQKPPMNDSDVYVIKTFANGSLEWYETYGGSHVDAYPCIFQNSDGSYTIAYFTHSYSAKADFGLIKINQQGDIQWNLIYGGSGNDYFTSAMKTSDNGFILVGTSDSYPIGGTQYPYNTDALIIKVNESGGEEWQKISGNELENWMDCAIQTNDGGFLLCGWADFWIESGMMSYGVWLIKTDANVDAPGVRFPTEDTPGFELLLIIVPILYIGHKRKKERK